MPLSWNKIRDRAQRFSRRWADAHDEASEAKPFWIDFFEIFGITDKRVATFELAVQKFGGGRGRADLFWRGKLLNGYKRWCLWLGECPPAELRAMPER